MARTADADPDAMKRKAEPVILDAVATEIMGRGLQRVESQPELTLAYFLLLTTGATTQTLGQFLPSTTAWALPPFAPATQSWSGAASPRRVLRSMRTTRSARLFSVRGFAICSSATHRSSSR